MFWENLKDFHCPKCSGNLQFNSNTGIYVCEEMDCNYEISEANFKEISGRDEPIFSGFCEDCGRRIPPKYRTCKNCF